MPNLRSRRTLVVLALLSALLSGTLLAAPRAGLHIDWWTVDGGGGTSSSGALTLQSTSGQPDAGTLSGGSLTLQGGFWAAGQPTSATSFSIYLPTIQR